VSLDQELVFFWENALVQYQQSEEEPQEAVVGLYDFDEDY